MDQNHTHREAMRAEHDPDAYKAQLIQGFQEMYARWMTDIKLIQGEGYEGAPKEFRSLGLKKLAPLQEELTKWADEVKQGFWPAEVEPLVKDASLACARLWIAIAREPVRPAFFDLTTLETTPVERPAGKN